MEEENIIKLYDALGGDDQFGGIDGFKTGLENEENRRKAYDKVGGDDKFGSFEGFNEGLGLNKPPVVEKTQDERYADLGMPELSVIDQIKNDLKQRTEVERAERKTKEDGDFSIGEQLEVLGDSDFWANNFKMGRIQGKIGNMHEILEDNLLGSQENRDPEFFEKWAALKNEMTTLQGEIEQHRGDNRNAGRFFTDVMGGIIASPVAMMTELTQDADGIGQLVLGGVLAPWSRGKSLQVVMGMAGADVEAGSIMDQKVDEYGRENNIDTSTADGLREVYENKEFIAKIKKKAAIGGMVVGVAEGLGGGVASKFGRKVKSMKDVGYNFMGRQAIGAGFDGTGEATKQLVVDGHIDPYEVAVEVGAGTVQTNAMIISETAADRGTLKDNALQDEMIKSGAIRPREGDTSTKPNSIADDVQMTPEEVAENELKAQKEQGLESMDPADLEPSSELAEDGTPDLTDEEKIEALEEGGGYKKEATAPLRDGMVDLAADGDVRDVAEISKDMVKRGVMTQSQMDELVTASDDLTAFVEQIPEEMRQSDDPNVKAQTREILQTFLDIDTQTARVATTKAKVDKLDKRLNKKEKKKLVKEEAELERLETYLGNISGDADMNLETYDTTTSILRQAQSADAQNYRIPRNGVSVKGREVTINNEDQAQPIFDAVEKINTANIGRESYVPLTVTNPPTAKTAKVEVATTPEVDIDTTAPSQTLSMKGGNMEVKIADGNAKLTFNENVNTTQAQVNNNIKSTATSLRNKGVGVQVSDISTLSEMETVAWNNLVDEGFASFNKSKGYTLLTTEQSNVKQTAKDNARGNQLRADMKVDQRRSERPTVEKLKAEIVSARKVLAQSAPNTTIELVSNDVFESKAGQGGRGTFVVDKNGKGVIYINEDFATATTVGHEVAHAVLADAHKTTPTTLMKIHATLKAALTVEEGPTKATAEEKALVKGINNLLTKYERYTDAAKSEEFIVELSAYLSANKERLAKRPPLVRRVIRAINKAVRELTGIKGAIKDENDINEAIDFVNGLADEISGKNIVEKTPPKPVAKIAAKSRAKVTSKVTPKIVEDFKETGMVPESVIESLIEKEKGQVPLTPREKQIREVHQPRINRQANYNTVEFNYTDKDIIDGNDYRNVVRYSLGKFADTFRKDTKGKKSDLSGINPDEYVKFNQGQHYGVVHILLSPKDKDAYVAKNAAHKARGGKTGMKHPLKELAKFAREKDGDVVIDLRNANGPQLESGIALTDVSNLEWDNFVEQGIIETPLKYEIADKINRGKTLTEREWDMFHSDNNAFNDIIDEVNADLTSTQRQVKMQLHENTDVFTTPADVVENISGLTKENLMNSAELKPLIESGMITFDKTIADFPGKGVFHTPDRMFGGSVKNKDGKTLLKGEGGILYPIVNAVKGINTVWASVNKEVTIKFVDQLNRASKTTPDGSASLLINSSNSDKTRSSTSAIRGGLNTAKHIVENILGFSPKESTDFFNEVQKMNNRTNKKGKIQKLTYGIDGNDFFNQAYEQSDPETSSFDQRKELNNNIISVLAKTLKGRGEKFSAWAKEFIGKDDIRNPKSPSGIEIGAIIDTILAENTFDDIPAGYMYAVVQAIPKPGRDPNLPLVRLNNDTDRHASYNWAVDPFDNDVEVKVHFLKEQVHITNAFLDQNDNSLFQDTNNAKKLNEFTNYSKMKTDKEKKEFKATNEYFKPQFIGLLSPNAGITLHPQTVNTSARPINITLGTFSKSEKFTKANTAYKKHISNGDAAKALVEYKKMVYALHNIINERFPDLPYTINGANFTTSKTNVKEFSGNDKLWRVGDDLKFNLRFDDLTGDVEALVLELAELAGMDEVNVLHSGKVDMGSDLMSENPDGSYNTTGYELKFKDDKAAASAVKTLSQKYNISGATILSNGRLVIHNKDINQEAFKASAKQFINDNQGIISGFRDTSRRVSKYSKVDGRFERHVGDRVVTPNNAATVLNTPKRGSEFRSNGVSVFFKKDDVTGDVVLDPSSVSEVTKGPVDARPVFNEFFARMDERGENVTLVISDITTPDDRWDVDFYKSFGMFLSADGTTLSRGANGLFYVPNGTEGPAIKMQLSEDIKNEAEAFAQDIVNSPHYTEAQKDAMLSKFGLTRPPLTKGPPKGTPVNNGDPDANLTQAEKAAGTFNYGPLKMDNATLNSYMEKILGVSLKLKGDIQSFKEQFKIAYVRGYVDEFGDIGGNTSRTLAKLTSGDGINNYEYIGLMAAFGEVKSKLAEARASLENSGVADIFNRQDKRALVADLENKLQAYGDAMRVAKTIFGRGLQLNSIVQSAAINTEAAYKEFRLKYRRFTDTTLLAKVEAAFGDVKAAQEGLEAARVERDNLIKAAKERRMAKSIADARNSSPIANAKQNFLDFFTRKFQLADDIVNSNEEIAAQKFEHIYRYAQEVLRNNPNITTLDQLETEVENMYNTRLSTATLTFNRDDVGVALDLGLKDSRKSRTDKLAKQLNAVDGLNDLVNNVIAINTALNNAAANGRNTTVEHIEGMMDALNGFAQALLDEGFPGNPNVNAQASAVQNLSSIVASLEDAYGATDTTTFAQIARTMEKTIALIGFDTASGKSDASALKARLEATLEKERTGSITGTFAAPVYVARTRGILEAEARAIVAMDKVRSLERIADRKKARAEADGVREKLLTYLETIKVAGFEIPRQVIFSVDLSFLLMQGGLNVIGLVPRTIIDTVQTGSIEPVVDFIEFGKQTLALLNPTRFAGGQQLQTEGGVEAAWIEFQGDEMAAEMVRIRGDVFGNPLGDALVSDAEEVVGARIGSRIKDYLDANPRFASIAGKPIGKPIGAIGGVFSYSANTYTMFMNNLRLQQYKMFVRTNPMASDAQKKIVIESIMDMTGRGVATTAAGKLVSSREMSLVLAAPRLYLSRWKVLQNIPVMFGRLAASGINQMTGRGENTQTTGDSKLDYASLEMMKQYFSTGLGMAGVYAILTMMDWEWEDDQKDKNFLRFKKNDEVMDISAGMSAFIKVPIFARYDWYRNNYGQKAADKKFGEISATQASSLNLRTVGSDVTSLLTYKLHPTLGIAKSYATKKDAIGRSFGQTRDQEIINRTLSFAPISVQESVKVLGDPGESRLFKKEETSYDYNKLLTTLGISNIHYENDFKDIRVEAYFNRIKVPKKDKLGWVPSITSKHAEKYIIGRRGEPAASEIESYSRRKRLFDDFKDDVKQAVGKYVLDELNAGNEPTQEQITKVRDKAGKEIGKVYYDKAVRGQDHWVWQ